MPPAIAAPDGTALTAASQRAQWRRLGVFWCAILAFLAGGAITLQMLGPPQVAVKPHGAVAPRATDRLSAAARPGRVTAGPIAAPDPALMDPASGPGPSPATTGQPSTGASIIGAPRIAPDGRAPMQVYAAGFDPAIRTPRIGVVLAGIGPDAAASLEAIRTLPAAVTLAVSPYSAAPNAVLDSARQAGHEFLLSIPMEPQGYPQNDPGAHALTTSASPAENARQLDWTLTRIAGYVGTTAAFGEMRGERFASVPDQMDPVLATLARRGLLYVDPRPGAARLPDVWSCDVDIVIDDPPSAEAIDARLAELEKRAHDTGVAIGLVSAVRPVTLAHLKAWAGNLAARGAVLAPVSALVTRPPGQASPGKAAP